MLVLPLLLLSSLPAVQSPTCTDSRLVIESVAAEPDIVTPTGLAVDEQGRIWVIENHTHQRPQNYKGPASDRIRVFEDFGPDGKARKIHTFAEGFKDSMGLALGKEGVVYLATRSTLYRLRDRKGTGTADQKEVLVKLVTSGNYPHNGLSGFAFDGLGNLCFGLGENLGASYELVGADGITLKGGGEGGSVYRCDPHGKGLRRLATGFWNPFHLAFDAQGRLFAVDNDPDARGPCRLLHVVAEGDYGYRFRYGRKGLHPFQCWNGELPGTLPMASGTSEAPSGILCYQDSAFPAEYEGQFLVTSWGDHVIERFTVTAQGASVRAQSKPWVRGGENFRPVGIALAPDGSVIVTDWVDKSYPVHGKGRIWRVRAQKPGAGERLTPSAVAQRNAAQLVALMDHPRRDIRLAAGAALAASKGAEQVLRALLVLNHKTSERARLHALWAAGLLPGKEGHALAVVALNDPSAFVRAEALALLEHFPAQKGDEERLAQLAEKDPAPAVRFQALLRLHSPERLKPFAKDLASADPFLVHAALVAFGRPESVPFLVTLLDRPEARVRLGAALALRRAGTRQAREAIPRLLEDSDPGVRRAAIQWVAEERLKEYAGRLDAAAARPPVRRELFEALLAARPLLEANPKPGADSAEVFVAAVFKDEKQPLPFRTLALRMLRPDHPLLTHATLEKLARTGAPELRREAIRTLAQRSDEKTQTLLRQLVTDRTMSTALRLDAVAGLALSAPQSAATRKVLLALLEEKEFRRDALRSLRQAMTEETPLLDWWEKTQKKLARNEERWELAEQLLLARPVSGESRDVRWGILGDEVGKPPASVSQWTRVLQGKGNAEAGERIFSHVRGPQCALCHRIEGRGGQIGPELSTIGVANSRARLIESILEPSKEIAPLFTTWKIELRNGKTLVGLIVDEAHDSTLTLADQQGQRITLRRLDIEERTLATTSVMPDNLQQRMTRQEFRDLLQFLVERGQR